MGRVSFSDTDTASDWAYDPATLGVLNGAAPDERLPRRRVDDRD
ncbi:hypothetical protein [Corallococcus llansteffanensis]|nr:hypothetical protein [Corallococcus llansteffanensis]